MATELLRIRDSTTTSIRDPSTWTRVLDTPLLQTHAADSNANSNLDSALAAATTPAAVAALGGGDELSVFRVPALEQLIAVAPIGAFAPANNGGFVPLGEDASSSSSGAEGVESAQLGAPRRRVAKKRWYAVQKDKKSALERELRKLQAQKARYEDSAPHRAVMLLVQQQKNEELRQAILEQQLLVGRAQSAITGFSIAQRPPFEKYIHLPLHCADRVATLINMKDSVLRDAERYLAERKRFLGPTMKYSHAEKFELPNGDYCYTGFDSFPLEGVASVRQAFDAIHHYFFNMEITYTEMSGEVMVRESDYDETGDSGVTAHRFVRSTSVGTQVEANSVLFSAYREASSPQQCEHRDDGSVGDSATISVDFVNTDERFPYASSQRVRQDTTAAISVTAYPRSRRGNTSVGGGGGGGSVGDGASRSSSNASRGGGGDASSPASGDFVIMFTRSYFAHLHRSPELGLPSDAVTGIGFISDFCFTTLIKSLYETAKSTPPPQSAAAEEAGF